VSKKASGEQGGGGLDSDVNPDFYDMLLQKGVDQAKIIGSYGQAADKSVTIELVGVR
jgi:hypothetical protein